ncbi:MGH1-like glycoside hydrolase domain-containing protein [Fictibacillus terranigra]|uniref:Trehalase family glycosidase n=1 Tax=Fictibacillus terranigra TaxID=3058424 RepID=A0ABT8EDP7_9BACL|nr:trehalase family glycosidase [Fictibacillus sp. CENA-BCM004]MDN4075987.1 trehalase family glycosidase [Fictibacillus sp. CENA-BCM004]
MEQNHSHTQQRGQYFRKKTYQDTTILPFSEARSFLPEPFCEKYPNEENCYWRTWELAYKNIYQPTEESGFVSNFVDAAFNQDIFMWDTAFITMFCNIGHPYIPGIRSLDNFYCKQLEDGEIPREIIRESGEDFSRWVNHEKRPLHSFFHNHYEHRGLFGSEAPSYEEMYVPKLGREVKNPPYLTLDNLNHPIMAWAELESYRHTGDINRLELVWEPLLKFYESMCYHLHNQHGLFVTDWASMDNSPRNYYLGSGVDISCEMVLFARNLVEMANILSAKYQSEGKVELGKEFTAPIKKLENDVKTFTESINRKMWDKDSGFYYDVTDDGQRSPVKTIAAYWSLLGEVADEEQAKQLAKWLQDPKTFARVHRVPTLAADEEGYNPDGGYWRGSVWAPTNMMVTRGLEKYGYDELAQEIALSHLENVVQVFEDTGTIWENYAPDSLKAGDANNKDFVGWSGIAPILYFLEYRIGLRGNSAKNELTWKIDSSLGEVGCHRYWFAGHTINLRAVPQPNGTVKVDADSDGPFTLHVQCGQHKKTIQIYGKEQFSL